VRTQHSLGKRSRAQREGHEGHDLRASLPGLPPKSRDLLRRALVGDQADRYAISSALLRYRDAVGDELADTTDLLTMNSGERRRVVRLLAEIDASGGRDS
jgi:hypothetical protein